MRGRELLVAYKVDSRARKQSLIAVELSLHLRDGGLERTRIDLRQQVALLDGLPFLELDADQLAADLRLDGHRRKGRDRAESVDRDVDIALLYRRNADRRRDASSLALAGWLSRPLPEMNPPAQRRRDGKDERDSHDLSKPRRARLDRRKARYPNFRILGRAIVHVAVC